MRISWQVGQAGGVHESLKMMNDVKYDGNTMSDMSREIVLVRHDKTREFVVWETDIAIATIR